MTKRTTQIFTFLQEIEKYKIVEREMYCSNTDRKESDAEHSWHLAMFIILFKEELPDNLDTERMLKLALMHDLVEIYAWDTFAYDKENKNTKVERELNAAKKLFSQLPEDLENEFMKLFIEYENWKTNEAKIVKSFDKIQPIMQNLTSTWKSWKEHKISIKQIDDYKRKYMLHNEFILDFYNQVMEEVKNSWLIE